MDSERSETEQNDSISPANLNVPNVGTLFEADSRGATQRISQALVLRDRQMASQTGAQDVVPARVRPKNVMAMLDLLGASLDLASATMDMTATDPGHVSYSVIFKNDADIILQPYEVSVPTNHYYHQAPSILFPGESSNCMLRVTSANARDNQEFVFRFAVLSTDPARLSGIAPMSVPAIDLTVTLVRASGRMGLRSVGVNGTILRTVTASSVTNELQYVSLLGSAALRMPAFGIAVLRTHAATQHNQASGSVVAFTPAV